jgi:hypothetical protein
MKTGITIFALLILVFCTILSLIKTRGSNKFVPQSQINNLHLITIDNDLTMFKEYKYI